MRFIIFIIFRMSAQGSI